MGARRTGLIAATVLALLGHSVALNWLAVQWQPPSLLQAMGKPVLTRLIAPAEPAPPPSPKGPISEPKWPPTPVSSMHVAMNSIANASPSAALEPTPVAPPPPPVAPEPPAPVQALPAPPAAPLPSAPEPEPAQAAVAPTVPTVPTAPPLDSWPTDTRLSYQVTGDYRGPLHGDATVQWQRQGSRYQVQVEVSVALIYRMRMTSQGEVNPTRLRPVVYEEIRRNKTRAVRLGERDVTLDDGRRLPRPAGVQDTASQFVELAHRFASGLEPLQVGTAVSYWMARPGGVDLWTYDVTEQTTLYLPTLGAVQAFHLKPRPIDNPRGNIRAEMWFAPSLQYLPVRIRIAQGEDIHLDLMVDRIEQR